MKREIFSLRQRTLDADAMYDEIGSVLKIKQLQSEKKRASGISGNVLPRIFPWGSAGG